MSRRRSRRIILDIDEMLSDEECTSDDETICVECTQCGKAFRVRVSGGDNLRAYIARKLGCSTNECPDCMSELYGDDLSSVCS